MHGQPAFQHIWFIPARAGNRPASHIRSATAPVHPRACGEQFGGWGEGADTIGSSPRVRGTGLMVFLMQSRQRFIPARAGNSQNCQARGLTSTVHPRACGEQGLRLARVAVRAGSSPRVRGTVILLAGGFGGVRFIPARAGNRIVIDMPLARSSVHPRACGEQTIGGNRTEEIDGSSPRVRGTGHQRVQL